MGGLAVRRWEKGRGREEEGARFILKLFGDSKPILNKIIFTYPIIILSRFRLRFF